MIQNKDKRPRDNNNENFKKKKNEKRHNYIMLQKKSNG